MNEGGRVEEHTVVTVPVTVLIEFDVVSIVVDEPSELDLLDEGGGVTTGVEGVSSLVELGVFVGVDVGVSEV